MTQAEELRARFRKIPKADRDANQDFAIRVWRALSWLERAESVPKDDIEGRFISCWIGFNALYGRLDDDNKPWGDRESLGTFLAKIWRLDEAGSLRRVLGKRQNPVLNLINNKFISSTYWHDGDAPARRKITKEVRRAILAFPKHDQLPLLQMLFERLYVLRNQVFHGASTKGSYLNRRTLSVSGNILMDLLPACLELMIHGGVGKDWGSVCFPPRT